MSNETLSAHLTWAELACKDGTPYPENFKLDGRAFRLAFVFESIRDACGNKPIKILSAYRTPTWNKKIGGALNSQHVQGRALDLKPPVGMTIDKFYEIIKNLASFQLPEIKGIGRYRTFVHVDIRPTTKTAYWSGTGVKDSRT